MEETVLQQLTTLISFYADIPDNEIKEKSNMAYDLGLDSLDISSIAVDAERHFDILIRDSDLEEITTVKDFYEVINKALEFKESRK
jgi:acyl carrier protein